MAYSNQYLSSTMLLVSNPILVSFFLFLGVFTQSAVGFGATLVSMPFLVLFLDLKIVVPLVAVISMLAKILLVIKYHEVLDFKVIWRLLLTSLIFVPVGVKALNYIDTDIANLILGIVILGYALYSMMKISLPKLSQHYWALVFGAFAGFLGGLLNASGPPVVIYANSKEWSPFEFKGNLQGFALINGLGIIITHFLSGNITQEVVSYFYISIPAALIGVWAGVYFDKYINPEKFRKIILWTLILLGIRLLIA